MKRSTEVLIGAATVAGALLLYHFYRLARERSHAATVQQIAGRGKPGTVSTAGKLPVALAGGVGAGAGRPTDTKTTIPTSDHRGEGTSGGTTSGGKTVPSRYGGSIDW